jgi:hypothetical protein
MYINRIYYKTDWQGLIKKHFISDRVKKYFNDLYIKNNMKINFNLDGVLYDYHAAGNYWYDFLAQNIDMHNFDFILFPQWSCTWQMDYAVPELNWLYSHNLDIPFYDIRDCGKLSVFYALEILLQLSSKSDFTKNLCLSIENKFLDVGSGYKKSIPQIDYMGCIEFISSANGEAHLKPVLCNVIDCANQDLMKMISQTIKKIIDQFKILSDEYIIYIKSIDGMINLYNAIQVKYPETSGFIYYCISMIFKKRNTINFNYALIVDVDEEANNIAILVIQIEKGES